ncbi:MAG: helix-turn-helix domain-containing protein [Polyangiaceae bacterium]|nr:helix-turn-helix domain-containing protein [Polyangiaceae bacterium]
MLLSAWVLSEGDQIDAEDLGAEPRGPSIDFKGTSGQERLEQGKARLASRADGGSLATVGREKQLLRQSLKSHQREERLRILEALQAENWNRVRAAQRLGMPRRTFYRRLKQYEIQK